eukprot:6381976-Prymnesium_polylepis.1
MTTPTNHKKVQIDLHKARRAREYIHNAHVSCVTRGDGLHHLWHTSSRNPAVGGTKLEQRESSVWRQTLGVKTKHSAFQRSIPGWQIGMR